MANQKIQNAVGPTPHPTINSVACYVFNASLCVCFVVVLKRANHYNSIMKRARSQVDNKHVDRNSLLLSTA